LTFISISASAQKQWTLQECIDYALANNIQIKKNALSTEQAKVDVLESKAALFPSLSFSTNHNGSYRPFSESMVNLTNGTMTTSSSETNYNGSYGLNANWTVWNGWRNTNNIKKSKLSEKISELEEEVTANSIQEQIAQLYIQILYETEAVKVDEEIVKASVMQRDRASVMVEVGSLAKADLAQLEAQVTQDQYSLVNAQSQLQKYKLQLKQLLEIHDEEDFDVVVPDISDSHVLTAVPSKTDIYNNALNTRPEIATGKLNIESAEMDIKIAKAAYLPTLSLTAGMGTSNSSASNDAITRQFKRNWNNSLGLTLSVPIFDNRSAKSSVQRAKLNAQSIELDLIDKQKQLYSDIENYWLNATTSQQQYIYAKTNVESMEESYKLISEQFRLGLKNIVELTTGKNDLLNAQQQKLQTKYTSLFNLAMLKFYQGEKMELK
jgi:outer membrane protein